ncbi:MAG: hypothetical protein HZA03_11670 [Nitrospinae bacterium]|nr:hypothetical protein [Nitrospinota bacterium]
MTINVGMVGTLAAIMGGLIALVVVVSLGMLFIGIFTGKVKTTASKDSFGNPVSVSITKRPAAFKTHRLGAHDE